ncbi:MAG: hypothetical protein Q8R40_00260 [bacterium]|nr:hypothetical protein [bacterium]
MFIFLLVAKATSENQQYSENEKHAALAFVNGHNAASARQKLIQEMEVLNWKEIQLNKESEIGETEKQTNPILADAFEHAKKEGFSVVIYEDAIK